MAWGGFGWLGAGFIAMLGSVEPCVALTVRGCRDRRGSNPWSNNANASTFTLLRTPGIGPLSRPPANLVSLQRERLPQWLALAGSPNGPFPGRNLILRLCRAHWIPKLPIMVVAWCATASTGVTGLLFIVSVWLTPHSPEKLVMQMFDLQLLTLPIWIMQSHLRLDVSAELTPPSARRI